MAINLAILKATKEGKDVTISSLPFSIGRCRSANFIITHVNVSRNHCQIVMDNNLWKINDCSSSGTFVNHVLVGKGKSKILNTGDVIRFGSVESNLSWTFILFKFTNKQVAEPHLHPIVNDCVRDSCENVKTEQNSKENIEKIGVERDSERNTIENKTKKESEMIQELQQELEQVQNALNTLEEKNIALQGELASGDNNKIKSIHSKLIENLTEVMETELQCTICSELFVTAVTLSCTHTFCKYCINQWKRKQKTCPICRKRISSETRSLVVDNYIDKMVGNLSAQLKEHREAIIKERIEVEPVKKRRSHK